MSLFSASQQSTTTPSLFGGSTSAKPATGLFGANNSTTTTTNTSTPAPNLFGNTNNTAAASSNTSTALPSFGAGTTPAKPPATTNLFGSNANTASPAPLGGLFSMNNNTAAQPATGGLFGANTNNATANTGLSFGGQQQPQQQQQQPQQITSLTRHSDLPESAQKELDAVDNYISQQIAISEDLKARKESRQEYLQSVPRDVEVLMRKLATTNQALANDLAAMTAQRQIVETATQDAKLCVDLLQQLRIQGARLPPGDPLLGFFERQMLDLERKIGDYKQVLEEVDHAVDGIENEIVQGRISGSSSAEAVLLALKEEYAVFMAMGNRVAELHHAVARLESREK